jgi:hypothetical protein
MGWSKTSIFSTYKDIIIFDVHIYVKKLKSNSYQERPQHNIIASAQFNRIMHGKLCSNNISKRSNGSL